MHAHQRRLNRMCIAPACRHFSLRLPGGELATLAGMQATQTALRLPGAVVPGCIRCGQQAGPLVQGLGGLAAGWREWRQRASAGATPLLSGRAEHAPCPCRPNTYCMAAPVCCCCRGSAWLCSSNRLVARRGRIALATAAKAVTTEEQQPKQPKKQQQQKQQGGNKKGEAKAITPKSEDFSRWE